MTIAKPFAVSRFDITFAQWDECTNSGACPRAEDNRWGRGDLPVINVSFEDAKLYTAWLSRVTGKRYRLLSEAEFEYAARAGTTTAYFWGDEVGQGNANCTECGSRWDGERTAPVGSFKPNAFGLHEMLGNVWKWCEITWLADEGEQNENVSVQRGLHGRKGGALRGGSWARDAEDARSASRLEIHEGGYRRVGIGFRLARDVGG
jgi:formylglycine-generating enzyme required for sulfatase activity